MTFAYSDLRPRELEAFGFARARDIAFNAVRNLWKRRREEGMTQKDLAERIGRDRAWVSRKLQGPGNWTMRTFGAFVVALNGEVEMEVHALEDPPSQLTNHPGAYEGYEPKQSRAAEQNGSTGSQFVNDLDQSQRGPARTLGLASPSP